MTAGIDLDSDVLSTLAEETNIVGVKLSCGQIGKLARLTTRFPLKQFSPFIGRADVLLPSLLAGSAGGILALANIAPKACVKLFTCWKEERLHEAKKLQDLFVHADWAITKYLRSYLRIAETLTLALTGWAASAASKRSSLALNTAVVSCEDL